MVVNAPAVEKRSGELGQAEPSFAEDYKQARAEVDAVDQIVRALDCAREQLGLTKADLARARFYPNPLSALRERHDRRLLLRFKNRVSVMCRTTHGGFGDASS